MQFASTLGKTARRYPFLLWMARNFGVCSTLGKTARRYPFLLWMARNFGVCSTSPTIALERRGPM
jgi:hypothetical protein